MGDGQKQIRVAPGGFRSYILSESSARRPVLCLRSDRKEG